MKLGCDPEMFLADANSVRSAIGLIGGTKDFPRHLGELGQGFAVQEDNVAVEFNTPPASSVDVWDMQIDKIISYLKAQVETRYGLTINQSASALFSDEDLAAPAAQEFGCDPDFNAWTGDVNPKPKADDHHLRSAGGHIHIECFGDYQYKRKLVKMCDLFLGVGSVLLDNDTRRKLLYGKAGACRYKDYGVEYRTLSNFWIFDSKTRQWAWNSVQRAMDSLDVIDVDFEQNNVLEAINNNNKEVAQMLVNKYALVMP